MSLSGFDDDVAWGVTEDIGTGNIAKDALKKEQLIKCVFCATFRVFSLLSLVSSPKERS